MAGFEFDAHAMEQAMRQAARGGFESIRQDYDESFARLVRDYKGRPVDEISATLAAEVRQRGDFSGDELAKYSALIADGRTVHFTVAEGRLVVIPSPDGVSITPCRRFESP
jgi:hypothetical protein